MAWPALVGCILLYLCSALWTQRDICHHLCVSRELRSSAWSMEISYNPWNPSCGAGAVQATFQTHESEVSKASLLLSINTFPILTRPLCRDWHCFPAPEPAALLFAQGLQLSGTENITELENITTATTISSIFNMHRSMWHLLISVTAQVLFFTTVGTRLSPLEDASRKDISVRHDYQVLTMGCYNGKLGQIQVQGRALLPDHRGWAYLLQRH